MGLGDPQDDSQDESEEDRLLWDDAPELVHRYLKRLIPSCNRAKKIILFGKQCIYRWWMFLSYFGLSGDYSKQIEHDILETGGLERMSLLWYIYIYVLHVHIKSYVYFLWNRSACGISKVSRELSSYDGMGPVLQVIAATPEKWINECRLAVMACDASKDEVNQDHESIHVFFSSPIHRCIKCLQNASALV